MHAFVGGLNATGKSRISALLCRLSSALPLLPYFGFWLPVYIVAEFMCSSIVFCSTCTML